MNADRVARRAAWVALVIGLGCLLAGTLARAGGGLDPEAVNARDLAWLNRQCGGQCPDLTDAECETILEDLIREEKPAR